MSIGLYAAVIKKTNPMAGNRVGNARIVRFLGTKPNIDEVVSIGAPIAILGKHIFAAIGDARARDKPERGPGPMLRSHRHCEGKFFASERAVDRSEHRGYSASCGECRCNSYSQALHAWMCTVCGYVYEEAEGNPAADGIAAWTSWEEMPADWVCPECGVGKHDFTRID